MDQTLLEYLSSTIKPREPFIQSLEKSAIENQIPIMEPLGIEFLLQLIRIKKPSRILEIGTAIGYSAIRMAQTFPDANVVSVERDQARYEEAIDYINQANLSERIDVILGDAFESADQLIQKGPYDLLFIDAAKGQYQRFFELFASSLKQDGVIISDNVLFHGYVADENKDDSRKQKIGQKIRSYNDWLTNHSDYHTVIVPIGDGVAISVRRGEKG